MAENLFDKGLEFFEGAKDAVVDFFTDSEGAVENDQAAVKKSITPKDNRTAEERMEDERNAKQFKRYKYPQELEQESQPHSVVFRIKTREQSRMGRGLQAVEGDSAFAGAFQGNDQNRINADQIDNLQGVYQGLVTLGGGIAGQKLGNKLVGDKASPLGKLLGGIAGGAAGAGGGFLVGDLALQKNRLSKTVAEIQLYVPQSPQAKYSAQWQEAELGALTGILGKLDTSSVDGFLESVASAGGGAAELLGRGLIGSANVFKAVGLNVDFRGALQASTKKVENPFKEQLFKTMGFRDFAFEYKFAPKNAKELEQTLGIIEQFKIHMHPDKDDTGLFLIYPSEFEIEFRYKGSRNQFVHQISSCALTDIRIDYGQGGSLTTFKDTKGAPSEITMQMAFKELEVLTRDRIKQGF